MGLKRGLFFVEKPQQSRRVKVVVKVVLWFVAMESKTKTRDWCRLLPKDTKKWIFFFLFFHIETKTLNPKRTTSLCLCFLLHHEDKILEREREGELLTPFFLPHFLKALFLYYTSSFLRHTTHTGLFFSPCCGAFFCSPTTTTTTTTTKSATRTPPTTTATTDLSLSRFLLSPRGPFCGASKSSSSSSNI